MDAAPGCWRRGWDSNPRCLATSLVFKTSSINHSNISPRVGNWSVPRRNLRLSKYNKSPIKSQSPFAGIKNIFLSRRKIRKDRRQSNLGFARSAKNSAISIKERALKKSDSKKELGFFIISIIKEKLPLKKKWKFFSTLFIYGFSTYPVQNLP